MHSWGRASALRLSALVPPTLRGFFPIVRFGLQHNKNLLLLYTVENRGADFAICSRYLQSITLHPPVPAFPICFCSRLVEIMALSSPIGCRLNRSHSRVAHFSVSFPHYTTFPSIGTASESLRPGKSIIRPRAIQRAVPHQRSGSRTVSPVVARLRAFVALLRPGQRPSPTEGAKRGVGPFVAGCADWWCWPLPGAAFCPPGRTMQAGPPGQCRRSIFVRDKTVAHRLSHRPATRVGRDEKQVF